MWNKPIKEVPAKTCQNKLEMVLGKFYQGYQMWGVTYFTAYIKWNGL